MYLLTPSIFSWNSVRSAFMLEMMLQIRRIRRLAQLCAHAGDDVADVADDGGEHQHGDQELDHHENVFEDCGRVRHVAHHGQRGGPQWWSRMVVHSGEPEWWYKVVVQSGGPAWWSSVVVQSGGPKMEVQSGGPAWWSTVVVQGGGTGWR